jgi:hypothetical protein
MPHAREWRRRVSELPPRTGRFRRARAHQPGYYHRPVTCGTPPPPPPARHPSRDAACLHPQVMQMQHVGVLRHTTPAPADRRRHRSLCGRAGRAPPPMHDTNEPDRAPAGRPTHRATCHGVRAPAPWAPRGRTHLSDCFCIRGLLWAGRSVDLAGQRSDLSSLAHANTRSTTPIGRPADHRRGTRTPS